MIGRLHLPLQHFDPPLLPLAALVMLNDTAVVAIEERDDDGGDYDHQLLDLQETLALEPTLVLGLLVQRAWILLVMVVVVAQMLVVVVECLGTSDGDSAAPVDLCLLRFYAMVILPLSLLMTSCFARYELTARCPSVLLVMDALVLLLSHPG